MGAFLASICYPTYNFLLIKIRKKGISALIVSLAVLLILIIPAIFLVKNLVQESYTLFLLGKQRIATGIFQDCTNDFCLSVKNLGQSFDLNLKIEEGLKLVTTWIIQRGSSIIVSVPKVLLSIFIVFFTMFYFLKDGKLFIKKLNDFMSMKEKKYLYVIQRLQEIIHGLVYGYLLVALIQGALGGLGFFIFGISSPLFWGVMMAFLALIPALGTGLVWFPASLFLFLDGLFQGSNSMVLRGIFLFVYSLIIVSGIDNIIKPKLVSDKAKVHPAIIMVGIFGGLVLFGAIGVILGPLILSLTIVFIDVFMTNSS
jgi:predicted PurR-regulated permease PerM